jgi:hypothetical protein
VYSNTVLFKVTALKFVEGPISLIFCCIYRRMQRESSESLVYVVVFLPYLHLDTTKFRVLMLSLIEEYFQLRTREPSWVFLYVFTVSISACG